MRQHKFWVSSRETENSLENSLCCYHGKLGPLTAQPGLQRQGSSGITSGRFYESFYCCYPNKHSPRTEVWSLTFAKSYAYGELHLWTSACKGNKKPLRVQCVPVITSHVWQRSTDCLIAHLVWWLNTGSSFPWAIKLLLFLPQTIRLILEITGRHICSEFENVFEISEQSLTSIW